MNRQYCFVRVCLSVLILGAGLVFGSIGRASAQTPDDERLTNAVRIYEQGELVEARDRLDALGSEALRPRDRAIRDLYRGLVALAFQEEESARDLMLAALASDCSVRLDPELHSPSRVGFLEDLVNELTGLELASSWPALAVGEQGRLQVTPLSVCGDSTRMPALRWSSSDLKVAEVSEEGVVRAIGAGQANIIASASGVSGVYRVTVSNPVRQIVAQDLPTSMEVGEVHRLDAAVILADSSVSSRPIRWMSSDTLIASIGVSGRLVARRPGRVSLVATAGDIRASHSLTVMETVAARIEVTPSTASMTVGESVNLTARVVAADGRVLDRPVRWSSRDPSVLNVDRYGVAQGVGVGSTEAVVEADGTASSVKIAVAAASAQGVIVAPDRLSVEVGESKAIVFRVAQADGRQVFNPQVTFRSSSSVVATVDARGTVRGLRPGTASVTLSSEGFATQQVMVTVTESAQAIRNPESALVGLVIPGAGQFNAGVPVRGVLTLAAVSGAVAWGLVPQTNVLCAAPVISGEPCPAQYILDQTTTRPNMVAGLAVAAGAMVLGVIDGWATLSGSRRRAALQSRAEGTAPDGLGLRDRTSVPTIHPNPFGGVDVFFKVGFR